MKYVIGETDLYYLSHTHFYPLSIDVLYWSFYLSKIRL